jgi:polar amino acid transport system substrate-binding protein
MSRSDDSNYLISRRAAIAGAAAALAIATVEFEAAAETLSEKIKKGDPVIVATEDDYRPFEFMENGKPAGLDNALFAKLKAQTKFNLQQQILPWTGILAGVSTGKFDAAVTGALVNKERLKAFDFAMPIAMDSSRYLKRANDKSINSIKDLSGKTCGVQAGSVLYAKLPELAAMIEKTGGKMGKVVQYTSYPEAYQDLASGRTDYVVNGYITLLTMTKQRPGVFEIGQVVSSPSYQAWPVKKGNKEMLAFLNAFLKKERASGDLVKEQQKWLGISFANLPEVATSKV